MENLNNSTKIKFKNDTQSLLNKYFISGIVAFWLIIGSIFCFYFTVRFFAYNTSLFTTSSNSTYNDISLQESSTSAAQEASSSTFASSLPPSTTIVDLASLPHARLEGTLAFIREDNLWVSKNGTEAQLTFDAIRSELPYQTGQGKRWYRGPTISPDGEKIVFVQGVSNDYFHTEQSLMIIDCDGKNLQKLDTLYSYIYQIAWLRNGKTIIYLSSPSINASMRFYSIDIVNSNKKDYGEIHFNYQGPSVLGDISESLADEEGLIDSYLFLLSPDDRYLLFSSDNTPQNLSCLNLSDRTIRSPCLFGSDGKSINVFAIQHTTTFSSDGSQIITLINNNDQKYYVATFDTQSGKLQKEYKKVSNPNIWPKRSQTLSGDGQYAYYSNQETESTMVIDQSILTRINWGGDFSCNINNAWIEKVNLETSESIVSNAMSAYAFKIIYVSQDKSTLYVEAIENSMPLCEYVMVNKTRINLLSYYPTSHLLKIDLSENSASIVTDNIMQPSYVR